MQNALCQEEGYGFHGGQVNKKTVNAHCTLTVFKSRII